MTLSLDREPSHSAVLVVEDEVLVRHTISTMLGTEGYKVIAVASAEEALEVLGAVPDIRAVVTDVELSSGGMNGFDLARKLSAERRVGVVAVSGRAAPEEDLPSGVYFIAKPFHRATLVQLVRDMIQTEDKSNRWTELQAAPATKAEAGAAERLRLREAAEARAGGNKLTPRQRTVLELLVQGKSNREIAEAMDLAENTVKVHMAAVFRALGVSSRTGAVVTGLRFLGSAQHETADRSRLS